MKIQSELLIARVLENDEMCMPQRDRDLKFIIWRNYFIIIYYQLTIIVKSPIERYHGQISRMLILLLFVRSFCLHFDSQIRAT